MKTLRWTTLLVLAAPCVAAAQGAGKFHCKNGEMVRRGLVRCWNCGAYGGLPVNLPGISRDNLRLKMRCELDSGGCFTHRSGTGNNNQGRLHPKSHQVGCYPAGQDPDPPGRTGAYLWVH